MITEKLKSYTTNGIVFVVHTNDNDVFNDVELFKDVTLELHQFYRDEISGRIAVISQFKDEEKGIKKEYIDYISSTESHIKKDKIFIVKDKNMSLAEFYNAINDIEGKRDENLPITHVWYKGDHIYFYLLSEILDQMIEAGEIDID